MWGAFQLLLLEDAAIRDHLPLFLSSPFKDVQEAGIAKVAEIHAEENVTQIIKIFREEEGRLKYSAALTLAEFPNDFSRTLIRRWYHQQTKNLQATSLEFESAIYSFLKIDPRHHFPIVLDLLKRSNTENIRSALVLINLFTFCSNTDEYEAVFDQYFILRDLYTDVDLTQKIIGKFGDLELMDWLIRNIDKGFSIRSIFSQCYALMGSSPDQSEEEYFADIDRSISRDEKTQINLPKDHKMLIAALINWTQILRNNHCASLEVDRILAILHSFERNLNYLDRSIPKIIELETFFLLSLPLRLFLNRHVNRWLQKPSEFFKPIADYYHSSLLLSDHRERILHLFHPHQPNWTDQEVTILYESSPLDEHCSRNEILWRFFQGELLGYDIPWPSIFPNPNYSDKLAYGLFLIYLHNVGYYIERNNRIAIDYALQLFSFFPRKEVIQAICSHFNYLSLHHSELLYQTVEYLPNPKFYPLLLDKYRPEEYEIASRIFVICDIFDLAIPKEIQNDLTHMVDHRLPGIKKRVRLSCNVCNNTYRYPIDVIFVDEEATLKADQLTHNSVWTNQRIQCKNCNFDLPFRIDDSQLEEILLQSRVDRILKTPLHLKNGQFHYTISLIDFPKIQERVFTPESFDSFVQQAEQDSQYDPELLYQMYIMQVRTYRSMQDWESCHKVLKKIEPKSEFRIEWLFLMGFTNYKLSEFAQACIFFKLVLKEFSNHAVEDSKSTFWEQATYFCDVLDSKQSKIRRFKVIKGRK